MSDVSRVEEIFLVALEQTEPDQRAKYLDAACAGDIDLRRRVEELLVAQPKLGRFLEPRHRNAPDNAQAPTIPLESTAVVGDRVGPYKLLERIGEGGMGEVWVADQQEPIKRRVALKLIKPGMDSRSVLARFEAERQALAVMDHPNIAKVLDAGTTKDGRPYFVMELVKGTPITEFADARKLTTKERLELFVPVCQAIQHAHMKGIIHRDIKPSNVLVELHDDRMIAKVIDFGVAKAIGLQLTEKTLYTGFGALVGTPAYMAPEQATFNAMDVDTRADVYALGVLLYELLAGSPPIEKDRLKQAALDEVLRIVRDEEPPRPSQRLSTSHSKASIAAVRGSEPAHLSQLMKGEIDWIVMKALEKDRTRRYESANGLAKDVQRYLNGEAVEACPPTLGYRMRKAYRRNRTAIRVASAFMCIILTAIFMGAYFLQQRFARQSRTELAVNELLSQATLLRGQAKASPVGDLNMWAEALAAAKQANSSLRTGEPSEALCQRVTEFIQTLESEQTEAEKLASEHEKDRKLFSRIEAIRIQYVDADEVWFYDRESESPTAADEAYAAAFREFGVDVDKVDPAEAARILRQRPQALEIALTIDVWALIRKDLARNDERSQRDPEKDRLYRRLVELACKIDDDPWRCALRSKIGSADLIGYAELKQNNDNQAKQTDGSHSVLQLLNNEAELVKQPARALYVIALILEHSREDVYDKPRHYRALTATTAILKRAWQLSPSDFQICWTLSQQGRNELDKEAFAMAAVAAAPDSPFARMMSPTETKTEGEVPLLSKQEFVAMGTKPPEWNFPHIVVSSIGGDKVYLGPTRYTLATEQETSKREEVVGELRWAVRLNPSSIELRENLAKTLVRLARFDEALAECDAILRLNPKKAQAKIIGAELYGMGQLDLFKELTEKVIRGYPNDLSTDLHALLAASYVEKGDRLQAFEEFRSAYVHTAIDEKGNQSIEVTNSWRQPMESSGTFEQVAATYRAWHEDKGVGLYVVSAWAGFLVKHDKVDDAIAVYEKEMSRNGIKRFLNSLSELLVRAKRPNEAIELYLQAISQEPSDVNLRLELAQLYRDVGNEAKRTEELNDIVELLLEKIETQSKDHWATYMGLHYRLARVYGSLGKDLEARKHLREYIQSNRSILSLNGFAMSYAANYAPEDRDGELAVEAATRACELTGYGNAMVLDTLATAYAEMGDFEAAVKWQLKAIEHVDNENERRSYEKNLKLFREKKTVGRE